MANVVLEFDRRQPVRQDWNSREVASFHHAASTLRSTGLPITIDRGVTDEGEPWFVVLREDTGDVIAHLARTDGSYALICPPLNIEVQGRSFDELLKALSKIYDCPSGSTRGFDASSRVLMHPSAMLIAIISAVYGMTAAGHDAQAAPLDALFDIGLPNADSLNGLAGPPDWRYLPFDQNFTHFEQVAAPGSIGFNHKLDAASLLQIEAQTGERIPVVARPGPFQPTFELSIVPLVGLDVAAAMTWGRQLQVMSEAEDRSTSGGLSLGAAAGETTRMANTSELNAPAQFSNALGGRAYPTGQGKVANLLAAGTRTDIQTGAVLAPAVASELISQKRETSVPGPENWKNALAFVQDALLDDVNSLNWRPYGEASVGNAATQANQDQGSSSTRTDPVLASESSPNTSVNATEAPQQSTPDSRQDDTSPVSSQSAVDSTPNFVSPIDFLSPLDVDFGTEAELDATVLLSELGLEMPSDQDAAEDGAFIALGDTTGLDVTAVQSSDAPVGDASDATLTEGFSVGDADLAQPMTSEPEATSTGGVEALVFDNTAQAPDEIDLSTFDWTAFDPSRILFGFMQATEGAFDYYRYERIEQDRGDYFVLFDSAVSEGSFGLTQLVSVTLELPNTTLIVSTEETFQDVAFGLI